MGAVLFGLPSIVGLNFFANLCLDLCTKTCHHILDNLQDSVSLRYRTSHMAGGQTLSSCDSIYCQHKLDNKYLKNLFDSDQSLAQQPTRYRAYKGRKRTPAQI